MKLFVAGTEITQLASKITTSGSKSECARTLTAEILQPADGRGVPTVPLEIGLPVVFSADGQNFTGEVTGLSKSTNASTITLTAKDLGYRLTLDANKVTTKITKLTPQAAAAQLASSKGVPVGDLAACNTQFSRKFADVKLYDAIMAGYILDSEQTGKKYYLIMDGTNMCVRERGKVVSATIEAKVNLMVASFSETVNAKGETERKGTVQSLGNAECITGNAVKVVEPYTGMVGLFYIDSDTHTWANGVYTNKLTLAWENTMASTKAAGTAGGSGRSSGDSGSTDDGTALNTWIGPDGTIHKFGE